LNKKAFDHTIAAGVYGAYEMSELIDERLIVYCAFAAASLIMTLWVRMERST